MKQLPRIVLKGDRQAAEEMIREGVRQFDILLQQMKFAGLEQDVRRVRYLDGSEIVCKSVFGDNTLEIYVPPEVTEKKVEFPLRGKFIVFYNEDNILMDVSDGIKMTKIGSVERPPIGWLNTSIALEDRVVDVCYLQGQSNDPFYYRGLSEWSRESLSVRSGSRVCLQTDIGYSVTALSPQSVPWSYAVRHSREWNTVCVAQMSGVQMGAKWTYVIRASKYVWDEDEYKLVDNIEKYLQCDEKKYPSDAYPTHLLYVDDEWRVLYNVGWYVVSKQQHVFEKRRLDIHSGKDVLVTTHGSGHTSADVHRHWLTTEGAVSVEKNMIEKCEESVEDPWSVTEVEGDFLDLDSRSRVARPECNTQHFNGAEYSLEWEIDDCTLGGFRMVEDIDYQHLRRWCLQCLNPEEYIPWKRMYRLWFTGHYTFDCNCRLEWPDGTGLVELPCPTPCWQAYVNRRHYTECSGDVEWEWTGKLEDIDGFSFSVQGIPQRGGAVTHLRPVQIPYRRLALLAGVKKPFSKPKAFFAKNEDVVKVLVREEDISVLVNDKDATGEFIAELERVVEKQFDLSSLLGVFAYVGGKNEQGLPS